MHKINYSNVLGSGILTLLLEPGPVLDSDLFFLDPETEFSTDSVFITEKQGKVHNI